ncbi:MAG: hypothetical protein IJI66_02705 [Erysipelotrichaceae bacterium]|nr:hypothetical protein [Erysipelotrichaceae bacterium]
MRSLFEELGMALVVVICIFGIFGMFSTVMNDELVQDKAIDFSDSENSTVEYEGDKVSYEDSITFRINAQTLPFNSEFNWKDYIRFDDALSGNACYAVVETDGVAHKIDLSEFVIPEAYINATDISSIKLINTRINISQVVTYILKWEGVSVKQAVYFDIEENPVKYTISGRIASYGGRSGDRMQYLSLYRSGEEYISLNTDDEGYFIFEDIPEGEYTLKATIVNVDGDGTYSSSSYAYNIPMAIFDEAIDNDQDSIALGNNLYFSEVMDITINASPYILPIGYTWQEFIDLGYTQSDGVFAVYNGKPVIKVELPLDITIETRDYVDIADEITEGAYHIGLMTKETVNGKEINYFGIYR